MRKVSIKTIIKKANNNDNNNNNNPVLRVTFQKITNKERERERGNAQVAILRVSSENHSEIFRLFLLHSSYWYQKSGSCFKKE